MLGHIRDAGGAFAEKEKALENQYFRKEQQRQLENLKLHLSDEIKEHEEQIKRLQESIKRHQSKIKEMEKKK
jgi:uncharacterized protein HemX